MQPPPHLVTLQSGHRNNIFYLGEPVTFTLKGTAASTYQVRDYWGNIVDQGPAAQSLTVDVSTPGWYKLYLYSSASVAPWGNSVGGTDFVIFRNDAHFPENPAAGTAGSTDSSGAEDEIMRGMTALGPQRHYVADDTNPAPSIQTLQGDLAIDEQYYLNYNDPQRPRDEMIAFPNGTSDLTGVAQVVNQFQDIVHYWEPRNEPNGGASGSQFATNEMQPFYQTIKSINPNLKVMGPGVVSIGPGMLSWIQDFLNAGGGKSIDVFSFHAYNNVNGDLWLGRQSLNGLNALLAQYGLDKKEKWQTEQGYFAPTYGVYWPRHQGRWTMMQKMLFEQYGIPKEHDHYDYDVSHGFWDFPTWVENRDGSLNPAAALMRVWSEELYGTTYTNAYDFGDPGNNLFIGSLFQGSNKKVAAFMSAGETDGQITLQVQGGTTLKVVSAFGVTSALPVRGGLATLAVPEIPVYVELAPGQTIQVVPDNWGPDLALQPGVTASASGAATCPIDANDTNDIGKIHDGILQNWYYTQKSNDRAWMSNVSQFPATVELDLPAPTQVNRVVIYCPVPWQCDGAIVDYNLQYYSNGQWVTINHVTEPTKTFPVYTPNAFCTVDTFYSDRCIFTNQFAPVTTGKIRVVVNDCTWGGGATETAANAGGQAGPHQFSIREIAVYSPLYNSSVQDTIQGKVTTSKGTPVQGVSVALSGSASAATVTDATGAYKFTGLTQGGSYTVTPTLNNYSFTARSQTYSSLVGSQTCNFVAAPIPSGSGTGLRGDYYSYGYDISNSFTSQYWKMSRIDATINFNNWVTSPPAPGVGPLYFAVCWTGQIEPKYSETYTFTSNSDDGMAIWVNGQQILNSLKYTGVPENSTPITLTAGQRVTIVVQYRQQSGGANAHLYWSSHSQPQQIIPQQYLYPAVEDTPPAVGISAPLAGPTVAAGTTVPVTAVAADAGGSVAQVSFYANGALIGTSTQSPYTANWKPVTVGTATLTATATDTNGAVTVSAPVSVTVTPAPHALPPVAPTSH